MRLKLAAVKLAHVSSAGLLDAGTTGATSSDRDRIVEAMAAARVGH